MTADTILDTFSEEAQLEHLEDISFAESHAIFRILMLAALVDGEMTHEELDDVIDEYSHLPFFDEHDIDSVAGEDGFSVRGEYLEALASDRAAEIIADAGRELAKEEHRLTALRMVALLVQSDGVNDAELNFCFEIGEALGIRTDLTEEIVRKAFEGQHPAFD